MFQTHGRKVAITFTGGIDSTVLAYWFCENADRINFLSPTPQDPSVTQRTRIYLVLCHVDGQANFEEAYDLLRHHRVQLSDRYGKRFVFLSHVLKVPMPLWFSTNALKIEGYIPPELNVGLDHDRIRTHEDLGPDVYMDGRNAIIFSYLLSWCSITKIPTLLVGHQYEIQEWDKLDSYRCRSEDVGPAFLDRMNLLSECGFRFRTRIEAPFISARLSKYEIVKLGKDLGLDLGEETYSCLFYPPCGKCGQCVIRKKAFAIHMIEEKGDWSFGIPTPGQGKRS